MGFFGRGRRPMEPRIEPSIRFLQEQDGPNEQQLKAALMADLVAYGASRAYLARVQYRGSTTPDVALCVAGPHSSGLLRSVDACFGKLAGRDAHLDIVFLTEAQETDLQKVCNPFLGAA